MVNLAKDNTDQRDAAVRVEITREWREIHLSNRPRVELNGSAHGYLFGGRPLVAMPSYRHFNTNDV